MDQIKVFTLSMSLVWEPVSAMGYKKNYKYCDKKKKSSHNSKGKNSQRHKLRMGRYKQKSNNCEI